jgi:hypothetical protein
VTPPALRRLGAAPAVLFAFLLLAAASGALRPWATSFRPPAEAPIFDIPAFPSEVTRPLSFGFRSVLADVMFLQAVQIVGDRAFSTSTAAGEAGDRRLARLLDYATELDPGFGGAYRFAGYAMPRHTSEGAMVNVLPAEQILQRGVRHRPDDWRISFALGFIQAFYLDELAQAAQNLALSARTKGAPAYLGLLSTRIAAEGGDLAFAERMARTMLEEASEESTRAEWETRLLDIRMERDLRALESAVKRFRARTGRVPASLHELVRAGDLPGLPHEPRGGRYELLPGGAVRSTAGTRLRLREKEKR